MFTIITVFIGFFLYHANAQLECRPISFESIEINLNDVRVGWTVDNDCAATYTVSHYISDYLIGERTVPHPVSATWLTRVACSQNNVTIHTRTRPDRGEIEPISTTFYVECVECKPINVEFEILEEDIRVFWTSNPCAVQYRVTHLIDGAIESIITVPSPVSSVRIRRRSCSKNQIIVSTIALEDDKEFEDVSIDVSVGLSGDASVQNLRYNSDTGYVEWEAPDAPDWCELEFLIEFSNENGDRETRTTNTFYDLPVYPCTTNYVNVTTRIVALDKYAASKSFVHVESVPEDIQIRDLHFNTEFRRFIWDPPLNTEHCDIRYIVDFTNEFQTEEVQITITNEYFEVLDYYPCTNNKIEVTTFIQFGTNSYSEPESKTHVAPITRTLPEHIRTDPTETGAEVVWYIQSAEPTVCVVTDFYFTISEEDTEYPPERHPVKDYVAQLGDLEYRFTELQTGTTYDYKLCFEFEQDPGVPLCTKIITFPTLNLETPRIELNLTTTSYIGVSWTTNENADRFITGHTVSIEPRGTEHFTPSYCDTNWNFTKEVRSEVPPDVKYVVFVDIYPSFIYNVTVTTHFGDLGVDRVTLEEDVVTLEYTPGYLDIEASYSYEPSTLYEVTLKAKWGIPCDVNGEVQSFFYSLRGELESDDGDVVCTDVIIGSGTVDLSNEYFDDSGSDPIYEIEIPDLLPFFMDPVRLIYLTNISMIADRIQFMKLKYQTCCHSSPIH
ncbi:hypothetical protein QE152_g25192 [Popillia japonica]|uniref:Fibronectin type-III domain-containing protein n=1 Tax=Popillia japonica TaxID=7064 RepID=A0AAW1K2T5_POPJA